MKIIFLLFALLSLNFSCKVQREKDNPFVKGSLIDSRGLDGCGWLIQLDKKLPDGTETLMPLNLEEFISSPKSGKDLTFKYTVEKVMNTCMAGLPVRLEQVR